MRRIALLILALVALLSGCGAHYPEVAQTSSSSGGGSSGSSGQSACGEVSWNHQIQPLVQTYCLRCHSDPAQFGAPHPLTRYTDATATSVTRAPEPVYQVMSEMLASGAMPPSGARPSADQVALVQQWAAAGAPEDACPGSDAGYLDAGAPVDAGPIDLSGNDFEATAGDFVVLPDAGHENNLYRCFPFEVSTEDGGARNVVQFAPVVDNTQILHHMILYRVPDHGSQDTPYDCFGGPQGASPQFMYGWAPGAGAFNFPADVGLPVKDGDQFVLQIHYHNFTGTPQTDASGVALWWTDQPLAHLASVVMLGKVPFTLIQGQPDATISGTCHVPTAAGTPDIQVFAAMPHMHTHGTEITTVRVAPDGGSDTLVDAVPWSFDNQHAYPVNMTVHPGDLLRTDCHYDTTGVTQPISYGENTENEMCFDFLFTYPVGVNVELPGTCLY